MRAWPGLVAAAAVALLIFGALAAVAMRAEGWSGLGPADWAAIRFTLWQAVVSAALSVGLAIPVARAIARRQFFGRGVLITLLGAPFVLPVIVAIVGLLSIFGRDGALNAGLALAGLPTLQVYGPGGVILAHVFFNLPLATRLVLQGWLSIPGERLRLAASLGFSSRDVARHLERPMLREVVPGALLVVFLICTTSFAVALTLGGGPRATTIELALYQAFRFDFDLGRAALLGLIQVAVGAAAAFLALRVSVPSGFGAGLDATVPRWDAMTLRARIADGCVIMLVALFLGAPLAAVVIRGLGGLGGLEASIWLAALRSLAVSAAATALTLVLAGAIAAGVVARPVLGRWIEIVAYLAIAVSPLALGIGLFIVLFPVADPVALALPVTALANAVAALPFAVRVLTPALATAEADYGRLADSLGLRGRARLRHLWLPRLRRPVGFAAGLTAALSIGDLGVIALFADPARATLPLKMYELMGAYRMADAAAAGLLLLLLALAAFWLCDRGGRAGADV
jgi:thiamine transport system permease protein